MCVKCKKKNNNIETHFYSKKKKKESKAIHLYRYFSSPSLIVPFHTATNQQQPTFKNYEENPKSENKKS